MRSPASASVIRSDRRVRAADPAESLIGLTQRWTPARPATLSGLVPQEAVAGQPRHLYGLRSTSAATQPEPASALTSTSTASECLRWLRKQGSPPPTATELPALARFVLARSLAASNRSDPSERRRTAAFSSGWRRKMGSSLPLGPFPDTTRTIQRLSEPASGTAFECSAS
jgi:hypothetical protein